MSWRTTSFVLAAICCWLVWRDWTRDAPAPKPPTAAECARVTYAVSSPSRDDDEREPPPAVEHGGGMSIYGFQIPTWAMALAPQAGEDLMAYRDRIVPLAQAAVAPQRARVARSRDDLAALAHLDQRQLAALDTATRDAATAIEEKALGAFLSGDFAPETFKPMTAVALARDMLDTVDRANREFLATLRDDQRAILARHPFDFGDYLLFSTRWEEALGLTAAK